MPKRANNVSLFAFSLERQVKVAIVDYQAKVRKSWPRLINSYSDLSCVWSCKSAEEALTIIPQSLPDVVLMEIFLPGRSGIEFTAHLKTILPALQIVMFSTANDRESVFRALEAGADGYLLKSTNPADLRIAVLDVLQGGAPLTCQIARCVVESFRKHTQILDESKWLSFKEERILMLLCQGHANREIAAKLGLSIHTVCQHLKRVFKKLDVSSRTEAAVSYMTYKTP